MLVIEATSFLPPPRSIDHSHYSAATAPGHQPPLVLPYLRRALVATDGLGGGGGGVGYFFTDVMPFK